MPTQAYFNMFKKGLEQMNHILHSGQQSKKLRFLQSKLLNVLSFLNFISEFKAQALCSDALHILNFSIYMDLFILLFQSYSNIDLVLYNWNSTKIN